METKEKRFKGRKLTYLVYEAGDQTQVLLKSSDVCGIIPLNSSERSQTRLRDPACDLADAMYYAAAKNMDFFEFLTLEFQGYPNQCLVRPKIEKDDWTDVPETT